MAVETTKLSAEDEEFFKSGGQADEPEEGADKPEADAGSDVPGDGDEGAGEAPAAGARPAKTKGKDDKPEAGKDKVEEKPIVHNKAALDAERNLRKKVEREREKERREAAERFARLEERLSILQEAREAKQEAGVPEFDLGPDPETDPVGALKWSREQRARDLQARRDWEAQQGQRTKAEQTQRQEYEAFERDFGEASREWSEALVVRPEVGRVRDALLNSLAAEIQFQEGLYGEPLFQRVRDVEKWHAVNARRKGVPIDDYIVQYAATRGIGLPQQQAQPGNGQAQPQAQPQPNNGAAELERLARAQDASATLSGAGGTAGGGKMTLEALDRMTPAEFKAYAAKINKSDPNALDRMVEKMTFGR